MLTRTQIITLLWYCAELILGGHAHAQNTIPNLQLAQQLFNQITETAVATLDTVPESSIYVEHRTTEANEVERLLYSSLVETLGKRPTHRLFAKADSAAEGVLLSYKIQHYELTYQKLPAGWLQRAKVRRQARTMVDFDLRHTTGRIYLQGALHETLADTLPAGKIAEVEKPSLPPLTTGTWVNPDAGGSWLEPVLLTLAAGAIVYAFYTIRSQ